jgi:hypothetical protein
MPPFKKTIMTTKNLHLLESDSFKFWCDKLSKEIMSDNFINEQQLSELIKNKILANEELFYLLLASETEKKVYHATKNAKLAFKKSKQDYIEASLIISSLKIRLKKYNAQNALVKIRDNYAAFKKYLKKNGGYDLYVDFRKYYEQKND